MIDSHDAGCWLCGRPIYADELCQRHYGEYLVFTQLASTREEIAAEMAREASNLPSPPVNTGAELLETYRRLGITGRGQITEAPPVKRWEIQPTRYPPGFQPKPRIIDRLKSKRNRADA